MKKRMKNHTSKHAKGGRSHKQVATLVRTFGELPVIDAPADMLICPKQEDIDKAVPADPEHCVFAECCRRSLNSHAVVFFHRYAYVDIPNPKDEGRVVARFKLPLRTRKLIEDFDKTGNVSPGGYLLRKPPHSHQLDSMRTASAERNARKRAAIINGEIEGEEIASRSKKRNKAITIGVRNGTGRVHFGRKEVPELVAS